MSLESGASPKAVQDILGHSTLALTMGTYAKANGASKRNAVAFATLLPQL
jgi:integrase